MKKILVPLALKNLKGGEPINNAEMVRETYIKKILKHGLLPVFVSELFPKELVEELYKEAGGILFMGGTDVTPGFYGGKPDPASEINEPERDNLEMFLCKLALTDKKPILGICRGAQLLAVASGGKLIQNIPDITEERHGGTYEGLPSSHHLVKIDEGSRARDIIEKGEVMANSAHHQAVAEPGTDMLIVGKTPAGIVEVIEHKDRNYFCFGIQSHPEAEDGPFEPFFASFAEAVKKWT